MQVIAGILGGFILAVLGGALVVITFAASPERGGSWGANASVIFFMMGIVVALTAESAAKAWRRLLLSSAVLSFLAPISAVIYTGTFMATRIDTASEYAGAEAAGIAIIGGGLLSGLAGLIGFSLGIVFLIIGLLVGRDKRVVYVERYPESQASGRSTHAAPVFTSSSSRPSALGADCGQQSWSTPKKEEGWPDRVWVWVWALLLIANVVVYLFFKK